MNYIRGISSVGNCKICKSWQTLATTDLPTLSQVCEPLASSGNSHFFRYSSNDILISLTALPATHYCSSVTGLAISDCYYHLSNIIIWISVYLFCHKYISNVLNWTSMYSFGQNILEISHLGLKAMKYLRNSKISTVLFA